MLATRRVATSVVTGVVTSAVAITQLVVPWGSPAAASAAEPLACTATVPGVTARGVPTTFSYVDGKTSSVRRGPDALGYQPRDIALPHFATSSSRAVRADSPLARQRARALATTKRSFWFTLSGQQLREVIEVDRLDGSGRLLSADYRTRLVRKRWSAIRQMTIGQGRKYLYVLNNKDQLQRYRFSGRQGNASVKFDATVGSGFGTIGSFAYARTISVLGAKYDVLLATDADRDELLEYTISVSNPTSYRRTVLAQGGWADLRATSRTASCDGPMGLSYDAIVGVDVFGDVRIWTDRNGSDGSGIDIVDRGVVKESWRPLAYGN